LRASKARPSRLSPFGHGLRAWPRLPNASANSSGSWPLGRARSAGCRSDCGSLSGRYARCADDRWHRYSGSQVRAKPPLPTRSSGARYRILRSWHRSGRVPAIALAGGRELAVGGAVTLAGFGQSAAMAREPPTLRAVDTTVVAVGEGIVASGSAMTTACRGDSGGPMLIHRDGARYVVGIIYGATAAICGSPAQVVPIGPEREWLATALARESKSTSSRRQNTVFAVGAVLVACVLLAGLRTQRAPRPTGGP
jgi:hypothetical protein